MYCGTYSSQWPRADEPGCNCIVIRSLFVQYIQSSRVNNSISVICEIPPAPHESLLSAEFISRIHLIIVTSFEYINTVEPTLAPPEPHQPEFLDWPSTQSNAIDTLLDRPLAHLQLLISEQGAQALISHCPELR